MSALPTLIKLTTPLGDKVLNFSTMTGVEELGRLFDYDLLAIATKNDLDPKALLGKRVTIQLELSDQSYRYFNGVVTRFGLQGAQGAQFAYGMELRPWLWLATRRADTRIFQNQSVPDILKTVFGPYAGDFDFQLTGTYSPLEYCVQYRETDFNFVSRLMEQEGIYYFFKHTADKHTMMVVDATNPHEPVPGHSEFKYRPQSVGFIEYECITEWRFNQEIQSGKVTLKDYDFMAPKLDLKVFNEKDRGHSASRLEQYDPPGNYVPKGLGERYAKLRIEELHARYSGASGVGNMSALPTGYRFTLAEHPRKDQNREHIVVSTRFTLRHAGYESGTEGQAGYTCQFEALDSREVFRSQRLTPKPIVPGPQTARVVGPAGEEIYTDKYGRIKVQFHWDREGKEDENSSCWLRVSSPWAGKGFGAISLPRIGHEVVVDFLEGNPDRPLVTGSVYNGDNMPPYTLPANATVSTFKSRSSLGGGATNFNELRFEDKKGKEYIWLQAEKNLYQYVKNDVVATTGNDEHVSIGHNRTETVGGTQHLTVGAALLQDVGASANLTIGSDHLVNVGGEHSVLVGKDFNTEATGSISTKAGKDMHVKVGMSINVEGGMNLSFKGGMNVVIEAGMSLTLKAGSSTIVLGPAGVAITGTTILLNSGGAGASGQSADPKKPAQAEKPKDPQKTNDPLPSH